MALNSLAEDGRESPEERIFFIRVEVWGRVEGRPERVAEFVGGPLRSDPGDIRDRVSLGIGCCEPSPYEASRTLAPHFKGEEASAVITLDFDLDALGGSRGGRMACFADLWGRKLSQEFQVSFIRSIRENNEDLSGVWGRLLAESQKDELDRAADSPSSEAASEAARDRSRPRI